MPLPDPPLPDVSEPQQETGIERMKRSSADTAASHVEGEFPIRVVYLDGTQVDIEVRGTIGHTLNRVTVGGGREYFFTKNGYYDGRGQHLG
jgi:hypothetical protein